MRKQTVFAHPITNKGKGLYLQTIIQSFLRSDGMALRRGLRVRHYKQGVSAEFRGFRFSWTRGKLKFVSSGKSAANLDEAYALTVKQLREMVKHYELKGSRYGYEHQLISA
jgi:hypothetical protein